MRRVCQRHRRRSINFYYCQTSSSRVISGGEAERVVVVMDRLPRRSELPSPRCQFDAHHHKSGTRDELPLINFATQKARIFHSKNANLFLVCTNKHCTSHPAESKLIFWPPTSSIIARSLVLIPWFDIHVFHYDEATFFLVCFAAIPVHGFLCKFRQLYDRLPIDDGELWEHSLMSRIRAWRCYRMHLVFAPFPGKLSS